MFEKRAVIYVFCTSIGIFFILIFVLHKEALWNFCVVLQAGYSWLADCIFELT